MEFYLTQTKLKLTKTINHRKIWENRLTPLLLYKTKAHPTTMTHAFALTGKIAKADLKQSPGHSRGRYA